MPSGRRARAVLWALLAPAIVLVPLVAFGDPEPAKTPKKPLPPAPTDQKYDPDEIVAISQFGEQVSKGIEKYQQKDFPAAIDLFKKAMLLAPRNALGPYLVAEGQLANGNMAEAEAAIQQAVEAAPTDAKGAATRARVLFLRADIYERQKKWDQAKTAWQAYNEAAAKVPDGGAYPNNGAERLKAISKVVELEAKYVAVRERIAADKADAGKKTPPKK